MNKNECNIPRERIIDFLLEELSYEDTIAMDTHIRECESCRSESDSLLKLFRKIEGRQEPVSSDTYLQLKKKICTGTSEKSKRNTIEFRRKQTFSFIISAAAVILFTILISNQMALFSPFISEDLENMFYSDTSITEYSVNKHIDDTLIIIDKKKYFKKVDVFPTEFNNIEHLISPSDVMSIHKVRHADFITPPVELFKSIFADKKIIARSHRKKPPKHKVYNLPSDRSIRYLT